VKNYVKKGIKRMARPKKEPKETKTTVMDQIKQSHYTAQEAYEHLGMSRDTFNNYVRRDPDGFGRVVFFGDHGYYRKDKIDTMKERIEALLLASTTANFVFRPARLEDLEQEDHMAYLNFGQGSLSQERKDARRLYLETNPYATFHLYESDRLVAFINLIPMRHEAVLEFRKGVRGWTFPSTMIEQFEPGKGLECIIIDLATITNAPPEKRNRFAGYLLHHLALQLTEWGKQGIDIKSIDACGGTLDGRKILKKAGFEYTGTFKIPAISKPDVLVDRDMYHLDIDMSDLPLLQRYKQAISEWKASHITS
jgi:hypothetical protein